MTDSPEHIQFRNIRVDASGLAEMDRTHPLVFVPRSEVVRAEITYGPGAERPIVNIILAVLLFALSVAPLVMLANALRGHGRFDIKFITALAFAVPAGWLLDLAVRKRWLLQIQLRRGRRKLLFPRDVTESEVRAFWNEARSHFHYA